MKKEYGGVYMNNLERLHEANKELDKVLNEIKIEQSKIKNEITEKRNDGWYKMFDDLFSLKKYSRYIDTGINIYSNRSETLGFEIREDYICVISWKHVDSNKRPIEPRTETYFFTIKQDKPFQTRSHYDRYMEYVILAIENWDDVMEEIEKRLEKKMEIEMKKKITNAEKRQMELEKQLIAISK